NLLNQREKPLMVANHIRGFDAVFQNLTNNCPHLADVDAVHIDARARLTLLNHSHIDDRYVVYTQALSPKVRPMRLPQIARLEVCRGNHQQCMIMRVSTAISLGAGNLGGPYPPHCRPDLKLRQSLPRVRKMVQRYTQISNSAVLYC